MDSQNRFRDELSGIIGFTIVELMLVIAIIGILAAFGIPLGRKMVENSRLNSAAAAVRSTLALARSRAVANAQTHCGVFLDTLRKGMVVFNDDNGNNCYDSTGADPDRIYRILQNLPTGIAFSAIPPTWTNAVMFRGDGSVKFAGSFTLRTGSGGRTKTITISKESGEAVITP